jgi:hypothetical protein
MERIDGSSEVGIAKFTQGSQRGLLFTTQEVTIVIPCIISFPRLPLLSARFVPFVAEKICQ